MEKEEKLDNVEKDETKPNRRLSEDSNRPKEKQVKKKGRVFDAPDEAKNGGAGTKILHYTFAELSAGVG